MIIPKSRTDYEVNSPGSGGRLVLLPLAAMTRGDALFVSFLSDTGGVLSVKHFSIKPWILWKLGRSL